MWSFWQGSEFSNYKIEFRNRVMQNNITVPVTNSKILKLDFAKYKISFWPTNSMGKLLIFHFRIIVILYDIASYMRFDFVPSLKFNFGKPEFELEQIILQVCLILKPQWQILDISHGVSSRGVVHQKNCNLIWQVVFELKVGYLFWVWINSAKYRKWQLFSVSL